VLYDTLIEKLSTEEVCAILAHEIGHAKSGHVKKMMLESAAIYLLAFITINAVMRIDALYTLGGFAEQSIYAALFMFLVVAEPFGMLLSTPGRKGQFSPTKSVE
jgi:STE24 endopeptidase